MQRRYDSLLQTLSASQIGDLIAEHKIRKDAKFFYAVDPNELKAYAFPFGTDEAKERDFSDKFIVDEHIALYNLINNSETPLVLMDEYLPEIKGYIRHVANYSKENRQRVESYTKSFVNIIERNIMNFEEWQDHHRLVTQYLPFLITYSIGLHSEGLNSLSKVFSDKKIVTEDAYFETNESTAHLSEVFIDNLPGLLTERLFASIQPKVEALYRYRLENEKFSRTKIIRDLDTELLNKERDCKVVDRIININRSLEDLYKNKFLEQRHIVLFLSSAGRVEDLFKEPEFMRYMPEIDGKTFNIHRKSAQLYLNLILNGTGNDTENAMTSLEILQTYVQSYENRRAYADLQEVYSPYYEKVVRLREKFENYNLLRQYSLFREDIEAALAKSSNPAINKPLRALIGMQKDERRTTHIMIEDALIKLNLIEHFIKARDLKEILSSAGVFASSYGNDHIRGFAHHLPLLFFTHNDKANEFIRFISDCYLLSRNKSPEQKVELLHEVEERSQFLLSRTEDTFEPDEWLVILLLFLLLPGDANDKDRSGKLVLKEVKILLNLLRPRDNSLISEYTYLGSFAARRVRRFDDAERLIRVGLESNPTSPLAYARLYHSYCLLQYSRYKDVDVLTDPDALIKSAIEFGETALGEYEKETADSRLKFAVDRQKAALYNTLAYLYGLQYVHNNGDQLDLSDKYMEEVKRLQDDYESYPEFLDTEAFISLLDYRKNHNYEDLENAEKLITQALLIDPRDDIYIQTAVLITAEKSNR